MTQTNSSPVKVEVKHLGPCPRCHGILGKRPGLSRRTGADICSACSMEEAMVDWDTDPSGVSKKPDTTLEEIQRELDFLATLPLTEKVQMALRRANDFKDKLLK